MRKNGFLLAILFLSCLTVSVQAQKTTCISRSGTVTDLENAFPNEMKGFEFYDRGKLSGITIGVSKIEDVRSIFGTPLKTNRSFEMFDYNSDWEIWFVFFTGNEKYEVVKYQNGGRVSSYFNEDKKNEETASKQAGVTRRFVIKPENAGKITAILLNPKKKFSFDASVFAEKTSLFKSYASGGYKFYRDLNGLSYQVFDREDFRSVNNDGEALTYSRGDMVQIRYEYPCRSDYASEFFTEIEYK